MPTQLERAGQLLETGPVTVALTLLGDVRWRGAPVAGERSQALLAALAAAGGRPVRAERLIDLVWGDEAPANATKSLQVLVSRTRTACGADAIVRDAAGYRLGVDPAEVDSVRLAALVRDAAAALDDDADRAATLAREALALADGLPAPVEDEADPLAERPPRGGRRSRDRPRGPGAGLQPHRRACPGAARAGGRARRAPRRRGAARRPAAQRGRGARARGGARALRGLPAGPARAARHQPRRAPAAGRIATCWRSTAPSAAACATTRARCAAATATSPGSARC